VWRILPIAALVAIACHLLLLRSPLPGLAAALLALAVPVAAAGWALRVTAGGRQAGRGYVLLGVAAGLILSAVIRLLW
jgi:hypothetical protein